jgi:hypothetical protein
MRLAFKEWAIITDALLRGEQILIFRKGGLREGPGGFQIEHPGFLFFPTFFHQQREAVQPPAQARHDALAPHFPAPHVLRVEGFARVIAWRRMDSLESAQRLRDQHIWREEVIAARFDWGRSKEIHVLAVRAFRLPAAVELPLLASYGGCKSWVNLEKDISIDAAKPVLNDVDFSEKFRRFEEALEPVARAAAMP